MTNWKALSFASALVAGAVVVVALIVLQIGDNQNGAGGAERLAPNESQTNGLPKISTSPSDSETPAAQPDSVALQPDSVAVQKEDGLALPPLDVAVRFDCVGAAAASSSHSLRSLGHLTRRLR